MSFTNYLTNKIVNFILDIQLKDNPDVRIKVDGISEDIAILKELKDKLIERDIELSKSRVEWDKTFDAIIDNIVIIDKDMTITKVNRSFSKYYESIGGNVSDLIGSLWTETRSFIGVNTNCVVDKCFNDKVYQESTVTLKDRTFSVLVNPVFNDDGEIVSVVRVSRDITNLEHQRIKLDRRGKIFEAITDMSKVLVKHDNWEEAVDNVLSKLGSAVGASRTYIFRNTVNENRLCAVMTSEWVKSDICSMSECINYDILPEWRETMERGNPVEGKIRECHRCPDKDRCDNIDNLIVCAVPIFSDKKWWGFIGFDYNNDIKQWKEEDEALLRAASEIIGGTIYHRDRYYECLSSINNKS